MQAAIQRAAEALKAAGAEEVYVFGSVLSARFDRHSDVDMAVSGLPPNVFFQAMARAESALGRTLDLLDLDERSPLARYLRRKGKLQRVAWPPGGN